MGALSGAMNSGSEGPVKTAKCRFDHGREWENFTLSDVKSTPDGYGFDIITTEHGDPSGEYRPRILPFFSRKRGPVNNYDIRTEVGGDATVASAQPARSVGRSRPSRSLKLQRAMESAGVEFTNEGQPGVRMKKTDRWS
jgi:hypothetical protein